MKSNNGFNATGLRLAVRAEGMSVNAYFAQGDTMEGAVHLGAISRPLAEKYPAIFNDWKELMSKALVISIESILGVKPRLGEEESAPAHERAGHA